MEYDLREGEQCGEHGTAQGGQLHPTPRLHVWPTDAAWHVQRQQRLS